MDKHVWPRPCGCVVYDSSPSIRGHVKYCPTHAKAPEMLAVLRTIVSSIDLARSIMSDLGVSRGL